MRKEKPRRIIRWRKRLYEIIDLGHEGDIASKLYDAVIIAAILISLIPLAFHETNEVFTFIDDFTIALFTIDYILRFITADFQLKKGRKSFLLFPFTLTGLIDLAAILPVLALLSPRLHFLSVVRLVRLFKILKIFRYSENVFTIIDIILDQASALITVCILAGAYILISSLAIFNVEPETFETFFDALYWAVVSLTTVGYGDIYPVTTIGRTISMISSIFGIAIVALPAGIISASYREILKQSPEEREKRKAMRGLSKEERDREWATWNKEREEKQEKALLEKYLAKQERMQQRLDELQAEGEQSGRRSWVADRADMYISQQKKYDAVPEQRKKQQKPPKAQEIQETKESPK